MSVMVRDESTRDQTREDLHAAVRARKVAKLRYEEAMVKARAEGWSNTQIARACGVSEAAVRLYWKRHPSMHVAIPFERAS
jgi:DNA-binding NarL/FixJ family response regulator